MNLSMRDIMSALCQVDGAPILTSNQCQALADQLNKLSPAHPTYLSGPEHITTVSVGVLTDFEVCTFGYREGLLKLGDGSGRAIVISSSPERMADIGRGLVSAQARITGDL